MIIELSCDLDGAGVRTLMPACEAWVVNEDPELTLDLRNVSKIDSSGLGLLVHLYKRKLARGQTFQIANVDGEVLELLQRFSLLALFCVDKPRLNSEHLPSQHPAHAG